MFRATTEYLFSFFRRKPDPWRPTPMDEKNEIKLKEDIKELKPKIIPNILITGPIGAGKSSLINSCLSVGKGRQVSLASTGNMATSFTLEFRQYKETSLLKNLRLMDCMGIEQRDDAGLNDGDIEYLMNGNIKEGYTFDPCKPMTKDDDFYNPSPKPEDKIHCVVLVVDASAINDMPRQYVNRIKNIQREIQKSDVPRVLILTKADKLCEEVNKDIKQIFISENVKEAVDYASDVFNIEPASTHPLVNYKKVGDVTTEYNIPILLALRQIVQYACDKIEQES